MCDSPAARPGPHFPRNVKHERRGAAQASGLPPDWGGAVSSGMSQSAIIYAFRSPGSGAVYIGKHQCDPEGWPRRGKGRLPDGYGGSGVAVRNFHRRHGDRVEWRILATVTGGRDEVNAAERRAIRLARALLGKMCVNRLDGGDGMTSEEARAQSRLNWDDPGYVERQRAGRRAYAATPEGEEQITLARLASIAHVQSSETRAKMSVSAKAAAQRPQRKAQLARAAALNSTPEAIAKRQRTRALNDSWRRLAEQHPEWWVT